MKFIQVDGERELFRGGPKVKIAPRKFGHMSFSFRGFTYELKKEGSRIVLELPDKPPEPHGNGTSERPLGPADLDVLASHGFILEGQVASGMVADAVKEAVGTTDLKSVIQKEKELRGESNPAAPPKKKDAEQPNV